LITANISSPLDIFIANICVITRTDVLKTRNISIEKYPKEDVIMKNQNESPAVIASALNLMEDAFISNWINKCN
jgi:hypothetical protein